MKPPPQGLTKASTVCVRLPTDYGDFKLTSYSHLDSLGLDHLAIWKRAGSRFVNPLVRIHSECLTGDVFRSSRCDCGQQLDAAFAAIAREAEGILIYLRQEGRGIGLVNKLRAYNLQDTGLDTVEANQALGFAADLRDFGGAVAILADLGASRIRLITNNPAKTRALRAAGVEITESVAARICVGPENERYLRAKQAKLGHELQHLFEMSP